MSARPRTDFGALKAAYDGDGFVVVRGFLAQDELTALRGEVERFLREVAPHLPENQVFRHVSENGRRSVRQIHRMAVDPFFERYSREPSWTALASALVGEPVRGQSPIWLNKPPGTNHVTPPHQDNIAFCLMPPSAVQIFAALDPVDRENGCLRYVAGSHRQGPRPHEYSGVKGFPLVVADYTADEEASEIPVELQPGDVVCHHPETVHRARANRSASRSRQALAITFKGETATIDPVALKYFKEFAHRGNREGR